MGSPPILPCVRSPAGFATASDRFAGYVYTELTDVEHEIAGLLDVDKKHGTIANSVAPPLGTALGGLLAGALTIGSASPHLLAALGGAD